MKLIELVDGFPHQESVKLFKQEIKGLTEKELLELSIPLLDKTEGRGRVSLVKILSIALKKESSLLVILDIGCKKKLVSEIGEWLNFLVPRISFNNLIKLVDSYKNYDMDIVNIILYKLQFIIDPDKLREFE
ncbi:hypothetical protein [Shewanella hanedai]|uniref:Uncharacterized protein n=1 Tax=Shewanella hanedai TaxID=25 RepID=A0A553JCR4_SHEHA|nr:hypothetical protein [Shewanella hanedai]TRY10190.1 hypothetical protein FN961_25455 [Shewanella hanedai]